MPGPSRECALEAETRVCSIRRRAAIDSRLRTGSLVRHSRLVLSRMARLLHGEHFAHGHGARTIDPLRGDRVAGSCVSEPHRCVCLGAVAGSVPLKKEQ